MLRKDRIYEHLKKLCTNLKSLENNMEDDIKDVGFSASQIAADLNIIRSNVSADLNKLYKEGSVFKIEGRPTLYVDKEWALNNNFHSKKQDFKENDYRKTKRIANCFTSLIGYDGSLNSQVKQAQAAILYPPHGLSTLILGETGTGKTMFVDYMYKFALENKVLKEKAPLVSFNCADYSNNPELLMSILFGSVKGAYTGSDTSRCGLVEKADGGILFLDEVHRLPPEGQEMLFTLLDKGKFRRLGGIEEKSVNILTVAATTEPPESVLLGTFYRRIPIVIKMPGLGERPVGERLKLISHFFNKESMRIQIPIKVSSDVLTALAMYLPPANVGDIKSCIELASSRGYMEYLINQDSIRIVLSYLPENVKGILLNNKARREEILKIIGYEDKTFFQGKKQKFNIDYNEDDFSNNVYVYLDEKFNKYKHTNMEKEKLKDNLYKDLEEYFIAYNRGLMSRGLKESELSKFIDDKIVSNLKLLCIEIKTKFNFYISENTFVALAFHINSMYERRAQSSSIKMLDVKDKNPIEYKIATYIYERLSSIAEYKIPKNEIEFISMILHLTGEEKSELKKIPIVVIAHGDNVATNMVSVVNTLWDTNHVVGIDMSLKDEPSDVLKKAIGICKHIDEGKGILLMVDMGSLKTFGSEITKETGISVITIDNLSMPILMEASHKSMLPYSTLKNVALSVIETGKNLLINTENEITDYKEKEKVIFTTCSTGKGTAIYLKKLILKAFKINCIRNVEVFEINIGNKKEDVEKIKRLAGNRNIAAIVGSINPGMTDIPFINLMDFVTGSGLKKVLSIVSDNQLVDLEEMVNDRTVAYGAISSALDENLKFFSGSKIMIYVDRYIKEIEEEKRTKFNNQIYTLLAIHIAYAIERLKFSEKQEGNDHIIKSKFAKSVYKDFGIKLNNEEIKNINLIINESLEK
ncbi:sigma-54-dependent transcriptional regulator [Clostridium coskatii]|uniref:Arginine utilization regulatory protein RocR n=1 Tax=Clostridium coskatii TaxID=1705578 RepID=A0A162LG84_9CLOT|nr:sigma 54-interacting transcriptional regulator [Clostridium coskatii]OAA93126.1 Arginine utilization regulatory protein RocR [Clostridium coskatii]OBR90869.1 arginine utilization regulatory protein RocR [Clostridium coskatii]